MKTVQIRNHVIVRNPQRRTKQCTLNGINVFFLDELVEASFLGIDTSAKRIRLQGRTPSSIINLSGWIQKLLSGQKGIASSFTLHGFQRWKRYTDLTPNDAPASRAKKSFFDKFWPVRGHGGRKVDMAMIDEPSRSHAFQNFARTHD